MWREVISAALFQGRGQHGVGAPAQRDIWQPGRIPDEFQLRIGGIVAHGDMDRAAGVAFAELAYVDPDGIVSLEDIEILALCRAQQIARDPRRFAWSCRPAACHR